jgi:ABC-2 type transport system permease protein
MSGTAALEYGDTLLFKIMPLVTSPAGKAWNTLIKPDPEASAITFNGAAGDQEGPLPLAVGLIREVNGKSQRIVIAGDADLLSNGEIFRRTPEVQNFVFAAGLFRWFSEGAYPVETRRPGHFDNRLLLESASLVWVKIGIIGVLPGLLVAAGSLLLIIRRKR